MASRGGSVVLAGATARIQPFVDGLLALWTPANLPAELAQVVGRYESFLSVEGARFNLWWLLNNSLTWLRLVMPGLAEPAQLVTVPVQQTSTLSLILWVPFLLVLGLGLGVGFLTAVTSQLGLANHLRARPKATSRCHRRWAFGCVRGLRAWGLAVLYGAGVIADLVRRYHATFIGARTGHADSSPGRRRAFDAVGAAARLDVGLALSDALLRRADDRNRWRWTGSGVLAQLQRRDPQLLAKLSG